MTPHEVLQLMEPITAVATAMIVVLLLAALALLTVGLTGKVKAPTGGE